MLENIFVVLDTKIVIQELNVEYTVRVDMTSTHGNDILAAAPCSLSFHNEFIWTLLDCPISELFSVPFWIVGIEAKLLVEITDDIFQVWGHTKKGEILSRLSSINMFVNFDTALDIPLIHTFRKFCMQSCSLTQPSMALIKRRRTLHAVLQVSVVIVPPSPSL